jgi:hypothetical protein
MVGQLEARAKAWRIRGRPAFGLAASFLDDVIREDADARSERPRELPVRR